MNGFERMLDALEWEPLPPPDVESDLPYATHHGFLDFGTFRIEVFVLNDGRRVIEADALSRAIGP